MFKDFFINRFYLQINQKFFYVGILFSLVFIAVLTSNFLFDSTFYIAFKSFHIYAIAYTVFTPFLIGFFVTTFPKIIFDEDYTRLVDYLIYMQIAGSFLYILGIFISLEIAILGSVLILLFNIINFYYLIKIFRQVDYNESEIRWVTMMIIASMFGQIFYIASLVLPTYMELFTKIFMELSTLPYLFSTSIMFIQKLVPDITGDENEDSNLILELIFLLSFFHLLLVLTSNNDLLFFSDLAIMYILGYKLIEWGLSYHVYNSTIAIVLYIAIIFGMISFFLSSVDSLIYFSSSYENLLKYELIDPTELTIFNYAPTHILTIGFLSIFMFGFVFKILFNITELSDDQRFMIRLIFPVLAVPVVYFMFYSIPLTQLISFFEIEVFGFNTNLTSQLPI